MNDFETLFANVCEALRSEQRISYRALRRRFELSDDDLEDIQDELIYAKKWAIDEDSRVLVWVRETDTAAETSPIPSTTASTSHPTTEAERAPVSFIPKYLAEKILTSRSAVEGERKVVTVLFADIKDSTELIRDLDPEDAQKLLDPAIRIMMAAVHRFEGTVNQVLGDGIMSIFGAPLAHEDHAARACYAALAMQSAMREYTEEVRRKQGLELRIRVGLNSGEVVVRAIGNDLHMDYSAVGQTVHLAARMEQLASPGSIRLSSSTLKLVEGLVQVNDLGPIPVKGMDEPVEVYELTSASSVRRRLQAAVSRGLTKFVGRDTEIEALNQALERAGAGHGQIVAAVGEAGVGKSRLVYEFIHSHRTQGWLVLESASVSYDKATPYFPVIDLLKRYVHVEDGDDARTIRAKVTGHILTLDETLQDTIPALLSLLDALPEDSSFSQLDPPQRRQRTLDGLKRILLRESQIQPLVLVFEDLHWHDNESQAFLNSLVESLPTAQLLLLVNYRPEYTHSWVSKTYYIQLRLDPLPPDRSDELLEALLENDASLASLKRLLIERTAGNPFFLEESVRTLVETGTLVGEGGSYRLTQDLPSIQVPPTVQAVLAARIDRLPEEEKRLLQTAAIIGMDVPFALLNAIAELSEDTLSRGLTNLQAAEFLYETNLFPERIYTFKHALTHEVAYGSLLQERRRVLHARIVDALEALGGDRVAEQVERLAHHALRGEVWDKALKYARQAGDKAVQQFAYQEARGYYEQALESLQHFPDNRKTIEQKFDLRIDLHYALIPLGAYDLILDHLRAAQTLGEAIDDTYRLSLLACQIGSYFQVAGDFDQAIASFHRALALSTSHKTFEVQLQANVLLGRIYEQVGNYHQGLEVTGRLMQLLESAPCDTSAGELALPSVSSRSIAARCHAEMGTFDTGKALGEVGVRIAETLDDAWNMVTAYIGLGHLFFCQGDVDQAIDVFERSLVVSQTSQILFFYPFITSELAVAYALVRRNAEAQRMFEQGVEHISSKRPMAFFAIAMTKLSEASLLIGHVEDASERVTRALALSRDRKQPSIQAHALRLLGDIAVHRDATAIDQTKHLYQQALTLANDLGMRPLQAHCHRGLGILYRQTEQAEQARTELTTAIEMYKDMEMTFWLPETEAMLSGVEGR